MRRQRRTVATPLPGLAALSIGVLLFGCAAGTPRPTSSAGPTAGSPRDATYRIEGREVSLVDGMADLAVIPGTASQTTVQVRGEPAWGDLNADGVPDAAVHLVATTGGSGMFSYIAAAIARDDRFTGSDAILLGDRIGIDALLVTHGLAIVDYRDRAPGTPMASAPARERSRYFLFDSEGFREIPLPEGELLIAGEVVIGHEVHLMRPCGEPQARRLHGDSPAMLPLQVAYHLSMSDASPGTPLFMIVTGSLEPAGDGSAIRVSRLIRVGPGKRCTE